MGAGARVADLGPGHERNAIDLARRRSRAAGALRDVFIDFAVFEGTGPEAFHRGIDHPWIDLLDFLPRKTHAIERAGREVFDQHVALFDKSSEYLIAGRSLGIEGDAALV